MRVIKKLTSAISLLLIYLIQTVPVYASINIVNGLPVVTGESHDIWAIMSGDEAWNKLFAITGALVGGITGIVSIAMVGVFIFKAFRLANSGSNPTDRQKAIQGIIYSMVSFVILGGISVIIAVFYGLLK